jgi:hypothetical protein
MFWKKKKEETATSTVAPAAAKAERLTEPQKIPEMVGRHLIDNLKMDVVWVWDLKAVVRKRAGDKPGFDIRVYDELEMAEKKVKVKDYTSLDERPDLILYEGWFDRQTKQISLKDLATQDYTTLNEAEIQQKIEGLKEPGSTVFFYLAGGSASGGPLRRGAGIVELNPNYPGAKQKKYNIYRANVKGTQPVDKGQKASEADKARDAAKWIKNNHFKPWWYRTLAK